MSYLNFLYKIKNGSVPNTDPSISAKIFINYWKLPVRQSILSIEYHRWIDVGVILDGVSDDLEEVVVCFPFQFEKENVEDLSKYVKNEKFVSNFLKKRYRCLSINDSPTYYHLEEQNNKNEDQELYLYEICDNSKDIHQLNEGSVFILKILSYPKKPKEIKEVLDETYSKTSKYRLYFQFRINGLSEKDLSRNEDISNDLVQSAFSKSEMVDLIFNDLTNIDHSDYQDLTKERELLPIEDIDFAFIGSSEDETIISNKPHEDCESLDPRIWDQYMTGINTGGKNCIAYHWHLSLNQQKVFFKTVYSYRHWKKILKYSLYIVLLSFIASSLLEGCKWGYKKIGEIYLYGQSRSQTQNEKDSTTIDIPSITIPNN